jgi:hypothetical protein
MPNLLFDLAVCSYLLLFDIKYSRGRWGTRGANDAVKYASSSELRDRTTQRLQRGLPLMAGMLALVSPIVYCVRLR